MTKRCHATAKIMGEIQKEHTNRMVPVKTPTRLFQFTRSVAARIPINVRVKGIDASTMRRPMLRNTHPYARPTVAHTGSFVPATGELMTMNPDEVQDPRRSLAEA
jgi:hypothetical protein